MELENFRSWQQENATRIKKKSVSSLRFIQNVFTPSLERFQEGGIGVQSMCSEREWIDPDVNHGVRRTLGLADILVDLENPKDVGHVRLALGEV